VDLKELFLSDDFNRYKVKEIQRMNQVILSFMNQGKFGEAQGALKMAQAVMRLPSEVSTDDSVKRKQDENIKTFASGFIREGYAASD
jgi:hypothetical protein